jgi:hypothetical protein
MKKLSASSAKMGLQNNRAKQAEAKGDKRTVS